MQWRWVLAESMPQRDYCRCDDENAEATASPGRGEQRFSDRHARKETS